MQHRGPGQFQPGQECDVDATQVVAFDQDARPVVGGGEILGAQTLEDADILDFLQRDDVGTAAVVGLQDDIGNDAQLLLDDLVAPVPVEALLAPATACPSTRDRCDLPCRGRRRCRTGSRR
jgi:hypothetical protein